MIEDVWYYVTHQRHHGLGVTPTRQTVTLVFQDFKTTNRYPDDNIYPKLGYLQNFEDPAPGIWH